MLTRQKLILSVINFVGGRISRLELVKLLFLYAQESESEKISIFYQFVPYHYGPFSFALYHDIDGLIRNGLLTMPSSNDLQITLNSKYQSFSLEPKLKREIENFCLRYGKFSMSKLIDTVYSRYPWFTLKSKWKERRAVLPVKAKSAVYTVGYESLQVDGFLNLLLKSGIRQVVDIRYNPIARRYGFHKSTLSKLCKKLGINYFHVPAVGVPPAWRSELNSFSDYKRLFARYEKEVLPHCADIIQNISKWMISAPTVLVCQEADPSYCHRSRLAIEVSKFVGLDVRDLRIM